MAQYEIKQPCWKRAIVGILDFHLILLAGGIGISLLTGKGVASTTISTAGGVVTKKIELFHLEGWLALLLLAVIIAYFSILGRNGGTIFQRLFGMKRIG